MNLLKDTLRVLILSFIISFSVYWASAQQAGWQGPKGAPPQLNAERPINAGSVSQVKLGGFWAASLGSDRGIHLTPGPLPSAPTAGDIAIDSNANNTLKWYDGKTWQAVNATAAPTCTADTWSCGGWSACSKNSQTRVCTMTFDCPTANTPSPATSQGCTSPPCYLNCAKAAGSCGNVYSGGQWKPNCNCNETRQIPSGSSCPYYMGSYNVFNQCITYTNSCP